MSALIATPPRRVAAVAVVLVLAAAGWYLGSPLFIRTTANEAFPTVAPSAGPAAAAASVPASATDLPRTVASGMLGHVDALHNGTGTVLLLRAADAAAVLRFEAVAITNAPDVHVYLSRDTGGKWSESTSRYLGPLKATNGSFNYPVPADADLSAYRSVVVWCRQFSVLVTWADLR